MALAGPVVGLGHVERLDLEGPVGDEYERPGLPSVLDGLLALALGNCHVAEVLHQDLLVLGSEVVLVAGELLDLDPLQLAVVSGYLRLVLDELPYQVDRVAVLNPHERPVHALPEQRPRRLGVGRGHPPLEEAEVRVAPVEYVADDELDEPLGLSHELVEREERPLVLDVGELGEVLVRVGLLGAEALLAGVDLAEAADGRLERELAGHGQADLEGLPLGVVREHERLDREGLAGPLAVAHGHDVGVRELHVLLVHEQVHGHV
mmetsp:Transcript_21441/g.50388  ORF Transcript_21441/g.50388 Transcript_21441/m.50388 type:complete len:263 (+) Transcript_21441:389-1177(+)